jgi:hypothetical protein
MLARAQDAGYDGADGERLDDILSRGYVFAETGLHATLTRTVFIGRIHRNACDG